MAVIPKKLLADLHALMPLSQVLCALGVRLVEKGGKWACPSPFKEGSAARSFSVDDKANRWKDAASKKDGDAVAYLVEAQGYTTAEAVKALTALLAEVSPAQTKALMPPPSEQAAAPAPADEPEAPADAAPDYEPVAHPAVLSAKRVLYQAAKRGMPMLLYALTAAARSLREEGVPPGLVSEALAQSAEALGLVTPEERATAVAAIAHGLGDSDLPEMPAVQDGLPEHVTEGPPADWTEETASKPASAAPVFKLVKLQDVPLTRKRTYLVKGLVPRVGLVVVWGPPKCGKSFWAFDMAMHVAMGWEYRGRRVQSGGVVYIGLEGSEGFGQRSEAMRQHHQVTAEAWAKAPFFYMGMPLNLIAQHQQLIRDIVQQVGEQAPSLVVIDTLNRSFFGSESKDEDMANYVRAADAVRDAFNCAVLVVHHCGIDGTRPRGHTSLTAAADAQIAVRKNGHGYVEASVEYMKDGPDGARLVSMLLPVVVGYDEDDEPLRSCAVVASELSPARDERRRPPEGVFLANTRLLFFRDALLKAIAEYGVKPPPSLHLTAEVPLVVDYNHVKALYRQTVLPEEDDAKKHADGLRKALQRLREWGYEKRIISTKKVGEVGYIWPTGRPVYGDGFSWPPRERVNANAQQRAADEILDSEPVDADTFGPLK